MFELSFGMTQEEFYASGGLATHKIRIAAPRWEASGDDSADDDEEEKNSWAGWRDGLAQLNAAKVTMQWPDGQPVGRGHGTPYIKEIWAKAIVAGTKKVEERPDEGVRCRTPHHPIPIC